MATHSRIRAWKIPWTGQRSLAGYSPWGHKESDMTEQLSMHALLKLNQLLKIYLVLANFVIIIVID